MGFGTYRILITNTALNRQMALRIPFVSTSYQVYVNGTYNAEGGHFSTNMDEIHEYYSCQEAFFYNTNRVIEIIVQGVNKSDVIGGMSEGLSIGTEKAVINQREYALFYEIFLVGALFIMSLYHLVIFLNRRAEKS